MRNDLLFLAAATALLAYAVAGCGRRGPERSAVLASPTLTPGVLNPAVTQATIRSGPSRTRVPPRSTASRTTSTPRSAPER
jgi:hypothetical protein